ncbi:hypothetical protein KR054_005453 [Drosophila jambulina]|nr:hypothetical protein KR054_005453 [Drosophila jambulina]
MKDTFTELDLHKPTRRSTIHYKKKQPRTCMLNYNEERIWEPAYLRAKCKELKLEEEYKKYQVRLMNSYLGVFFVLHILVVITYTVVMLTMTEYTERIYPNVATCILAGILMLAVLGVNFFEDLVLRHRWISLLTSVLATLFVVGSDLGLNAYHYTRYDWPLNAEMDIYALCMIYMFLPIPSIRMAALLGFFASAVYVFYFLEVLSFLSVYAARSSHGYDAISVDIFHYLGFNMLGIFFRMMNDTMVRSSFLDRHQFIMEENWLEHALHQESMLLHNILPPQIAKPYQGSIKNKIMQADNEREYGTKNYQSSMAVEIYPDVSILYADVVNYTHLTTTLSVESLVMVLHDLYGRFDLAAEMYKVQRIKFLGDCYYCVAGLVEPDPDHAENAVALGLCMIAHIQEVRAARNLDIDMRIGIHSGSLFAGVIGQVKLQFDIWGADVDIANHLEATGKAGFVHISSRTLGNLAPNKYKTLPGTEEALNDPVLQKHPMSTYLITGPPRWRTQRGTQYRENRSAIDIKSRPVQGEANQANEMTEELQADFRNMPVGGFDFRGIFPCCPKDGETPQKYRREIGLLCTTFKDSSLEKNYLQQPDYIYKRSILLAWIIGVCLIYIQLLGNVSKECIVVDVLVFVFLSCLLFISWYKKLCWWKNGRNEYKEYNKFSCLIFRMHEKILLSLFLRIAVYLLIVMCYLTVLLMILNKCIRAEYELEYIESKLYRYEVDRDNCFHPWAVTNMMALILGMSYTFARVPFALKTCLTCLETVTFLIILFAEYQFVFQHSNTTVPYMRSEVAHCNRILLMLITLYVKEHQVEFNAKTNYRLNVNLKKKQKAASVTNQSIIILLNNILPSHVVELYLNKLGRHELYYENYRMISVMFAKLMNFKMDLPSLRVLNCIITEFDILLSRYKEYYLVEKIKVVGCTYMAACGLDFALAAKVRRGNSIRDSHLLRGRRTVNNDDEEDTHEEVVYLMTTFALDLMRTLASCNRAYSETPFDRSLSSTEIAIGISSGEVMAGVVGASQPHYDIWGNPVNMASRMQSTGLPGHIQVTEESAKILEDFEIVCHPRGLTYVKGRGEIPTYFVAIDERLKFISPRTTKLTSIPSRRFTVMSMIQPSSSSVVESESDES